ncbi:MAG: anthranilate synthase component I family protein [Bacteroidota bacterium]
MKVQDLKLFKKKALAWANTFEICCYLESNQFADPYGKYDFLIAAGARKELTVESGTAFDEWKTFYDEQEAWMFGLLSYDLKNEIEDLKTNKTDLLEFPDLYFFTPAYLIVGKDEEIQIILGEISIIDLEAFELTEPVPSSGINIETKITKETYIESVKKLQQHIIRGDIYEANFCQEFFAENAFIDPVDIYEKLNKISPTPFSGFFKSYGNYVLSASPERFIRKQRNRLISQPIKGTARRSDNPLEDDRIRHALMVDLKEQAENVMIVDLVRNDLTKSAVKGSVIVDELFGVYGFAQVYQMKSTISCDLDVETHIVDAIKNAFPMGSMTGAPKLRAMQLIDETEYSKRGIYSGAMGYIDPSGDFDFSVVIRTLLYNAKNHYLSFQVGGAITYASDAEKEYEECLLKASAMISTLEM